MLNLYEDEKIILVIRKHWFVMVRTVITFAVLLGLPSMIFSVLPFFTAGLDVKAVNSSANFFLVLYLMGIILFLFLLWTDYYLDMWIITTARIIDIEQHGLFNREISEIPLNHVQDVTLEIKGIIETFLKFGTIRIQTAGEREFTIHFVPHLYEAKDVILANARKAQKDFVPSDKIDRAKNGDGDR
jgi:uncharacterized membrane protein YdbT with pleckstrin-like domain